MTRKLKWQVARGITMTIITAALVIGFAKVGGIFLDSVIEYQDDYKENNQVYRYENEQELFDTLWE